MRHLYVNARFLTQPLTGVQRFALELALRLKELYPDITFVAPANIIHRAEADQLEVKTFGLFTSHLWEQLELPLYLAKMNNPLLLNLTNTAPAYYKNQIVTIHDASFKINPGWFSKGFILFYNFLIPRIGRTALKVITVSNSARQDLVDYVKIDPRKIEVVNNAPTDFFKMKQGESPEKIKGDFILAVSSLDPRKNFANLIKAFHLLNRPGLKLVLVGKANPVFADNVMKDLIGGSQNIVFTGYISDPELKALYQQARLFIYPSLYEGFGIPPLEAMACGCPTVVSDIASLREVCADATYYVQPLHIHDIARGINFVLDNPTEIDKLIEKGNGRMKLFDWHKSAERLNEIIRSCV